MTHSLNILYRRFYEEYTLISLSERRGAGPLDWGVRLYTARWAGLLVNGMRVLRRGFLARTERLCAAENKKR